MADLNKATAQRNDSVLIQKMINEAKAASKNEITIPRINPETGFPLYTIGSTVWLTSDTTVILDGCTLRFCDGVTCNMFATLGAWDTESTQALENGHKNVKIIGKNGATFEGGASNGKTERNLPKGESMMYNSFVLFRNVEGFEVSGITAREPRYWCFTFMFATKGSIHDIEFDCHNLMPNQDGIDLRLGCNNIDIYNISGATGDDTVALTALGGNLKWNVTGIKDVDIHDVTMKNINAGCSGGHGVIRLLAHDTLKVYNIEMTDVTDASVNGLGVPSYAVIRIGDVKYSSVSQQAYGDIDGVKISGVVSNSQTAILVWNENITKEHVSYENVKVLSGTEITVLDSEKFYS